MVLSNQIDDLSSNVSLPKPSLAAKFYAGRLFPLLSVLYKYGNCLWYQLSLIDNKHLQTYHCFTWELAYNKT